MLIWPCCRMYINMLQLWNQLFTCARYRSKSLSIFDFLFNLLCYCPWGKLHVEVVCLSMNDMPIALHHDCVLYAVIVNIAIRKITILKFIRIKLTNLNQLLNKIFANLRAFFWLKSNMSLNIWELHWTDTRFKQCYTIFWKLRFA